MSDIGERAKFWAMFAAAALANGAPTNLAAADADQLLDEFTQRWEWYNGGYRAYWQRREMPEAPPAAPPAAIRPRRKRTQISYKKANKVAKTSGSL